MRMMTEKKKICFFCFFGDKKLLTTDPYFFCRPDTCTTCTR